MVEKIKVITIFSTINYYAIIDGKEKMTNIINLIRNDYRNAFRPNGKKMTNDEYWDNFLWERLIGGDNPPFQGYDVEVMEENITSAEVSDKDYYAVLKFMKNGEEHYVQFSVWWDSWGGYNYDDTLNSMREVKAVEKSIIEYEEINYE